MKEKGITPQFETVAVCLIREMYRRALADSGIETTLSKEMELKKDTPIEEIKKIGDWIEEIQRAKIAELKASAIKEQERQQGILNEKFRIENEPSGQGGLIQ